MSPSSPAGSVDEAEAVRMIGPGSVSGTLRVPGDKSISHRALLLAGLARGTSELTGLSGGDDVQRTRQGLAAFGVEMRRTDAGLHVVGGLCHEPAEPIDLGNSGTAMRLFAGFCSGFDGLAVLTGDQYLRARPMDRVVAPLRSMGAVIDGRKDGRLAPLAIRGGRLTGIEYTPPVASAQVKSAVLLAGLSAAGKTTVHEPVSTRRHTEELLAEFGVEVHRDGTAVTVQRSTPAAARVDVPGDPSQAAFWVVAGLIAPDSAVVVDNLYLGHGRADFVRVLQRMRADITADPAAGVLHARTSRLRGVEITPEVIPGLVDEVPILAVAAAFADGTTVISGAGELRVKESDRIKSTVAMLAAFGATVTETEDGMIIEGGARLHAAVVDSRGDHRIAMAAAVCALAVSGTTTIHGWTSVATSYPGFAAALSLLTAGDVVLAAAQ